VRYTHIPTGIAAESRTHKSQHKNAENALNLLKARLYQIEDQKRKAEVEKLYDDKGEVAFGSQIRNYVLQPYTMAKDSRTAVETPHVAQVLDGDLDPFIHGFLRQKATERHKKATA
jgi:peptide chain release factor 2